MPDTVSPPRLVLASSSPRRRRLLKEAGYDFDVEAPTLDESPRTRETPHQLVERLAFEKSAVIASRRPGDIVLGCDTVLSLDGSVVGKPADEEDAIATLMKLSGRGHLALTGFCIVQGERTHSQVVTTEVWMRDYSLRDAEAYVATGEPLDRAGSYAIQGGAAGFVAEIQGTYDNVVGLPVAEVVAALQRFGVLPVAPMRPGPT